MTRPRRLNQHRKSYKFHAFTPAEDARIVELRAKKLTRAQISKVMDVSIYAAATRITLLETLASTPAAKVRTCLRHGCDTEFISIWSGHRVCPGCKKAEASASDCEPFGNFVVTL